MNGQKLEKVTRFKYLGTILCKNGTCSAEVRIRISSAMAALARLNRICRCNTISFASKFKLYEPLVTSILFSGCETWTLLADSEKRIQDFETKCMRKRLRIFYLEHKTNDWVRSKIKVTQELLQATVKRPKLTRFGHVTLHSSLCRIIL